MTINNKLQYHILLGCLSHEYSWLSTCTIIIPIYSLNQHALQVQFLPIISYKLHNIQTPTIFIPSHYAILLIIIISNAVINSVALCLIDCTCAHTILTTVYHVHYYNYAATGDVVKIKYSEPIILTTFTSHNFPLCSY